MNRNNCEINILVKGRKVSEYQSPMDFQTYVEGRDSSEFEIEFVNNNSHDVEALLSVDGLSVTDGKPAGSDSTGYMVPARGRVRIPGWTLDSKQVANFFFAGAKGGSYAEQAGQDSRNKGVIGAKVYARKQTYAYNPNVFQTYGGGMMPKGGAMRGFNPNGIGGSIYVSGTAGDAMWSNTISNCAAPAGPAGATLSMTSGGITASINNVVTATATTFTTDSGPVDDRARAIAPVEQTLGTGFGDASTFETTTVDFERGDMIALVELFYDDAQGLKRRGIDVRRGPVSRPSAFPADEPKGCAPPSGWVPKK